MKFFTIEKEGPIVTVLGIVVRAFGGTVVERVEEADVMLAFSHREIEYLWQCYPEKMFVVMVMEEKSSHQLPANVKEMFLANASMELVTFLGRMAEKEKGENKTSPSTTSRPSAPKGARRVLIVDDTPKNILSALETVPAEFDLVTATGYDEAMELLSKEKFDIVLTDLHMPMSSRCLGPKAFRLGELVPYGLLIVMEALAIGIKEIAVVTDLGHHDDPFSAAFDHFTSKAIKTGKTRVRLLHAPLRPDGSKDWGKVLAD